MFFRPFRKQIWTIREAPHKPVNVLVRDGLQNDAAKLVFEELDSGTCLNAMLTAELRWDDKLAFRGKSST
jgi:hypothetical protein